MPRQKLEALAALAWQARIRITGIDDKDPRIAKSMADLMTIERECNSLGESLAKPREQANRRQLQLFAS